MRTLFVDFYKYSYGKRRKYLKRLYKEKLVYRTKIGNGYIYQIPDSVVLDQRKICIL